MYRKIKYKFKKYFFKLLSFLIGIIIFIVPFSASAEELSPIGEPSTYTITNVRPYFVYANGTIGNMIPYNWFTTYGSEGTLVSFDFNSSSFSYGYYVFVCYFDVIFNVDTGTNVDFSFNNTIGLSGTGDVRPSGTVPFVPEFSGSSWTQRTTCGAVNPNDTTELLYPGSVRFYDDNKTLNCSYSVPREDFKRVTYYVQYVFANPTISTIQSASLVFSDFQYNGTFLQPDGSSIENYEQLEKDVITSASSDFSSVQNEANVSGLQRFMHHLNAFQAVTKLFDSFILSNADFSALLWISLSLAILPVILGVAFSTASTKSRSDALSSSYKKGYNAGYTKGSGGSG